MSDCIRDVYATILDRRDNPSENSYTRYLFDQGIDKILKKVGEECERHGKAGNLKTFKKVDRNS